MKAVEKFWKGRVSGCLGVMVGFVRFVWLVGYVWKGNLVVGVFWVGYL